MIRKKLSVDEGVRKKFLAEFSRLGKKVNYKGYSEETILLVKVRDAVSQAVVADHLWFSYTSGFEKIVLKEGATIEFDARIKEYTKGYVNKKLGVDNRKRDFKLSHPTRIRLAG
jgi:hypothetical protein